MKFIATSDIHGDLPNIPECDAVLICGDISPVLIQRNMIGMTDWMTTVFNHWVNKLPCDKVFLIGGNHDFWMEKATTDDWNQLSSYVTKKLIVLNNEQYDYNGIIIYGTPECKWISNAWAYMNDIEELVDKYSKIPSNVDILMAHEAPVIGGMNVAHDLQPVREFGSFALADAIISSKPKYALCGHIHSGEHNPKNIAGTTYVNVSYKNEHYSPAYPVFTFEIEPNLTDGDKDTVL